MRWRMKKDGTGEENEDWKEEERLKKTEKRRAIFWDITCERWGKGDGCGMAERNGEGNKGIFFVMFFFPSSISIVRFVGLKINPDRDSRIDFNSRQRREVDGERGGEKKDITKTNRKHDGKGEGERNMINKMGEERKKERIGERKTKN
jgi:hypothetical protein